MCRYVTMQLTQWFQPQEATIISFTKSWSTVILKVILMLMLTIISFPKSWSTVILKVIMIDDLDVDDEDVLDHHDHVKVDNVFDHHIIHKSQLSST